MNFLSVGDDPLTRRFLREAMARGHHLSGQLAAGAPQATEDLWDETVVNFDTLEAAANLPDLQAAVVGGKLESRAEQLRQIIKQEPIDLVIATPLGTKLDIYYELSMVLDENKLKIYPLLVDRMHPALEQIESLLDTFPRPDIQWIEWKLPLREIPAESETGPKSTKGLLRFLEGWTWLRRLGGEIANVSATGSDAEGKGPAGGPVVVSGRFENALLFNCRYLPNFTRAELTVETTAYTLVCELPTGFEGKAVIRQRKPDGESTWEIDPTQEMIHEHEGEENKSRPLNDWLACRWVDEWETPPPAGYERASWIDATRQIELAEAVDRSLQKGRTIDMRYDDVSEEASFKSIMTLTGCALFIAALVVLIVAASLISVGIELPNVGYLILGPFVLYLVMQLFGLVYRDKK